MFEYRKKHYKILLVFLLIVGTFLPHITSAQEVNEDEEVLNSTVEEEEKDAEQIEAEQTENDRLQSEVIEETEEVEEERNSDQLNEDVAEEQESIQSEKEIEELEEYNIPKNKAAELNQVIVLENGVRHDKVVILKEDLKRAGFPVPGNNTTYFGKETEKQVKAFQTYYRLSTTGKADTETLKKLENIITSPFQKGKRHTDTKVLKANLNIIGYPVPGNGTTYFGEDTEKVIKKFQLEQGIIVNGIADEITWGKIEALKEEKQNPQILENGVRHEKVKILKANLKKAGFPVPGKGTTLFGNDTEKQVRAFQSYYGITVSGKADQSTLNKLDTIVNSPFQKGKKHNDTQTLKADLKFIGYPVPGNGTTLYGKDTETVVKRLQKDYKLVVNGIADDVTLSKIAELKDIKENPPILENGIRDTRVKTLKANLKKVGFSVPGNGTTLFGDETEKQVRAFQNYYGLPVNGKGDSTTLNKLDSIVNSPLQNGRKHKDTQTLKEDLKAIGYPVPGKGTTLYGKDTETVVKRLQKDQKLVVNGIADDVTLNEIATLKKTSPVMQNGVRDEKVKTLKVKLKKSGFTVPGKGTTLFGDETERQVKAFQKYYGLSVNGMADVLTLSKLDSVVNSPLQKGKKHKDTKKLKSDLKTIGYPVPGNGTTLYGVETEKIIKQFQKDNKLVVNGIADEVTLARIDALLKINLKNVKIFIDAGHGGTDSGAKFGSLLEKNLTLDIAKRTEKYLKQYKGVSIKMSRTNDKTLTLSQRTNAANNWKADFFFSVHINSGGGTGIESFIYNTKPTQDEINKQKIIHEHIANNVSDRDRGKKKANFHVLRESNMTAMLFEYYFIDTTSDRNKLQDASYRDKLAKLTAEGIAKAHGLKK